MSDVLRVGDRSPRVAEVRATLARLGLLPSFDGYVIDKEAQQFEEKDTFFDAALAEALQGFQQSRGLVPNDKRSDAENFARSLLHPRYAGVIFPAGECDGGG